MCEIIYWVITKKVAIAYIISKLANGVKKILKSKKYIYI